MAQIVLIGVSAGIASALLFASIISGALISLLLFYLAPLPIMIAALGWSHWSGLIAAFVAAAGLAAGMATAAQSTFNSYLFFGFLLGFGLPGWWLSYLALLARPVSGPTGETLEWYPVGRLLIWAAALSSLVVVGVLLSFGQTEESVRNELRGAFEALFRRARTPADVRALPDYQNRIDALVAIAPPAAAVSVTLINVLLLWLAARVVTMSNRLRRPWPDIAAMTFPRAAPALLSAAAVGVLLAPALGLLGIVSGVFLAAFVAAYAMLGLAVLHAITRGLNIRGLLLAVVYVAIVLIPPILVPVALIGLADTAFDIRGRFARNRGPPSRPT